VLADHATWRRSLRRIDATTPARGSIREVLQRLRALGYLR
jgi:hypothetical protein